jgi:hypothetical protein
MDDIHPLFTNVTDQKQRGPGADKSGDWVPGGRRVGRLGARGLAESGDWAPVSAESGDWVPGGRPNWETGCPGRRLRRKASWKGMAARATWERTKGRRARGTVSKGRQIMGAAREHRNPKPENRNLGTILGPSRK